MKRDGALEFLKPPSHFPFRSTKEYAAKKRTRNDSRMYFDPGENAVVNFCVKDDMGADVNAADGATFSSSAVTL